MCSEKCIISLKKDVLMAGLISIHFCILGLDADTFSDEFQCGTSLLKSIVLFPFCNMVVYNLPSFPIFELFKFHFCY